MRFAKMQGVGNDFVVIAAKDVCARVLPELALDLCRRKFSVGADGLLVIGETTGDADISFQMFNPDGSEDMCGNGLRCAALWAYHHNIVKPGKFLAATKDGPRQCELISVVSNRAVVRIDMGVPRFIPSEIPIVTNIQREFINQPINILGKILRSTALNTGSTHTVVFVDEPVDDLNFFKFSPPFENDPIFPERTSVLWTHQIEDARFAVRIWERGAGETLGCGTGACAAAVAAVVTGRAKRNEPIMITSKGGELSVVWSDTIWMTGPSVLVFDGEITE